MRIVTWNVNSIRARHDIVLEWLRRVEPHILCMQETKVVDDDFPTDEFARLGYEVRTFGQRSYNGVAIATRTPLAARCADCFIDKEPRRAPRPSDHAPVVTVFS